LTQPPPGLRVARKPLICAVASLLPTSRGAAGGD